MRTTAIVAFVILCVSSGQGAVGVSPKYRWPGGQIPFEFAPGFNDVASINGAIGAWHTRLGTTMFRPRVDTDSHWVVFVHEPDLRQPPCRVDFSGRNPNEQIVRVLLRDSAIATPKDKCDFETVLHELGHVIGLEHEHQRCDARLYTTLASDSEKAVQLDPLDGWIRGQYQTFSCIDLDRQNIGPYDFLSLMHYYPFESTTCINRSCLPFVLTEEGKRLLAPLGITTLKQLSDFRRARQCGLDFSCITDGDVRAVKLMYSLP